VQTDTFMATAAQVLPTLGIGIAIEVSSWYRSLLSHVQPKTFKGARDFLSIRTLGAGINLAIGELAALSALLFRYPGWTVDIPLALTSFSLMGALFAMAAIPFSQIRVTPAPPRRRASQLRPRRRLR
jgi:hypothetical protein